MKQIPSPNFYQGRNGYTPKLVVVHIMDGTLLGTDEWFSDPASKVSSHYGIGIKGEIHQYVQEENSAWTEGNVRNPTAKLLIPNINPNYYCLSIENEGHDLSLAPQTQLNALTGLIHDLCTRHSILIDRDHIIGHYEIDSVVKINCPSPTHSIMDTIVKKVALLNTNQNKHMIKWVKFYTTGSNEVITYFTDTKTVQNDGQTHDFTNTEDMLSKSTVETFNFWDNVPVGTGSATA